MQFEAGTKHKLFQKFNDPEEGAYSRTPEGSEADTQAEIIVKAVNEFYENDFSHSEVQIIKKLDKILDKVDMVATSDLSKLHFIVDTGETFTMGGKYESGSTQKPLDGEKEKAILEKAYTKYTQDKKLTRKEIEMIEKIDEILPDAAIAINPVTGDATLASPSGASHMSFPKGGGKRGK